MCQTIAYLDITKLVVKCNFLYRYRFRRDSEKAVATQLRLGSHQGFQLRPTAAAYIPIPHHRTSVNSRASDSSRVGTVASLRVVATGGKPVASALCTPMCMRTGMSGGCLPTKHCRSLIRKPKRPRQVTKRSVLNVGASPDTDH